jgi:rubrerythrin
MKVESFEDIIAFAIEREEEAIDTYGSMAEKAKSPGIKELLLELQGEERNHKKLLQNITKEKIESLKTKEVLDLKISDYLVEEPSSPEMNFQDLLILAAKKEQRSVDLYTDLGNKSGEEELKKLFEFLVMQEKAHKLKLEKEYETHVLEWD